MPCIEDLVYDVGMHNGDDTAYYLHKGRRVVAVEANPGLIPAARTRFAEAVRNGRLAIVNVGIARQAGEAEFYVSTRFDLLGSFDHSSAARFGGTVEHIRVPCMPFSAVLARHGVPGYLKVDIEGSDALCLEGLSPPDLPRFVSIEMSHERGDEDIRRLAELGYVRFQCVRQNDLVSVGPDNLDSQLRLRRLRARGGVSGFAARIVRRVERLRHPRRDGGWEFPAGASGRFGDELPGRWMSAEQMLETWRRLRDVDVELASGGLAEWFDVHAALPR